MSNLLAARRPRRSSQRTRRRRSRAGARSTPRYREAFADVAGHRVHARRARRRADQLAHRRSRSTTDVGAIARHVSRAPRDARHRGPAGVEADAPAAGVPRRAESPGGAVAERIFATGLCLPSGSSMTDAEQARVDRRRARGRAGRRLDCAEQPAPRAVAHQGARPGRCRAAARQPRRRARSASAFAYEAAYLVPVKRHLVPSSRRSASR